MRAIKIIAAGALALMGGVATAQQGVPPAQTPVAAPAVTGAGPTAAATAPTGVPALTRADVDTWLDGFMPYALANGDIAGAVVVVVKDGQVLTQRGFGYADVASRKPVDPARTLFRPGSVSKLVTWTAVMQLVEHGKIDLDADANQYLDFKIPAYQGKPITMREMMTHTAGFEDHAKGLIFSDPTRLTSLGDYLKSWVPNRIFAPGTTPAYSNYATALAGYIVERVSKMSFDDYVEQHIFAPLGMKDSTFRQPLPARFAGTMSSGYKRGSDSASKFELVAPGPAGSLSSTGADMARFMLAHLQGGELDGKRILSAETAKMMHDTPTTILPPLNRMELGFFETNVNNHQVIAHLGDTQLFHTALHLFMNDNVGIYLSVNSTGRNGAAGPVRSAFLTDFADRYFPDSTRDGRVAADLAVQHAKMMVGNWQSSRRVDTGFFRALGLMGQTEISVNAKGELVVPALKTAGGAVRKWVEIAPFVWRATDSKERLAAKVVDGKVVRWSVDGASPFMVFDRVPGSMSSTWLIPLLLASLGVLALSVVLWPVAALVRHHYKAGFALTGRARTAYRGVRASAAVAVAVLMTWLMVVPSMLSDLSKMTTKLDTTLWVLQIGGLIAFIATVAFAGWNLLLAFRGGRGWVSKIWAVLLLIAALTVLYVAITFGLVAMTVNY
jgi:CubicO group peptidase (beta-lactamase class C family)